MAILDAANLRVDANVLSVDVALLSMDVSVLTLQIEVPGTVSHQRSQSSPLMGDEASLFPSCL
jgi:hypothetical protein